MKGKMSYEVFKEVLMDCFEKLLEEADIYSPDKALLRRSMRNLLQTLDECVIYAHPDERQEQKARCYGAFAFSYFYNKGDC